MSFGDLSIGAIIGATCWELIKQTLSYFVRKKESDSIAKKAAVRKEIETLKDQIFDVYEKSLDYYSLASTSSDATALSRKIKNKLKICGQRISSIENALRRAGLPDIERGKWIYFRISTTENLDVTRHAPWSADGPRHSNIHGSFNKLQIHLTEAYDSI